MARKRVYPIRRTALAEAIQSIRRRLGLGQIGLTMALGGGTSAGEISRYESGYVIPGLKTLVALLSLAELPEERQAISEGLRAQGIEELLSNLWAAGLIAPVDHQTSIHPAEADCNLVPQVHAGAATAGGEVAPAPEDSQVLADRGDSSSDSLGVAAGPGGAEASAGPAPPGEAA